MAYCEEGSIRIFPSQSRLMNANARIDLVAHDGEIELVGVRDARPVVHARAAERIHTHAHFAAADHIHVEHGTEVRDIRGNVVVLMRRGSTPRLRERNALHVRQTHTQHAVGFVFDPPRRIRICRAAVRRVYLNPPLSGGLWDGVMTMPSASPEVRRGCRPESRGTRPAWG